MSEDLQWTFDAELWLWKADAAWHFVTLPTDIADEIEDAVVERRGFGSVRVVVGIGLSEWKTSIFPSREAESFLLPIKKSVRAAEELGVGDICRVRLSLAQ